MGCSAEPGPIIPLYSFRPRLCSATLGASKTRVNALVRAAQRPGHETTHAMNMRAAEAIVSKAPKAMKIFPISEV